MPRDLAELLAAAVPEQRTGPDLDAVEARVARRRARPVGAAVALVCALAAVWLPRVDAARPSLPPVDQSPELATCHDPGAAGAVLDGVDIDADGATDVVALASPRGAPAQLVACLADGRVTTLTLDGLDGTLALEPVVLAGTDGVALLGGDAGGQRHTHLVWLVGARLRTVGAQLDEAPGGSTTVQPYEYLVGDGDGAAVP